MAHKLLLADDSVTIQRVIELTFADEDVEVTAVGDGQLAIERLNADRFDIVLADIDMPKRDGYEVASYVKSRPMLAHIPVVLLTGAFEPIDQARAQAAGSSDVLAKPFEPQMVINRVKQLLSKKKEDGEYEMAESSPALSAVSNVAPSAAANASAPKESETAAAGAPLSLDDYFDQLDAAFSGLQAPAAEKAVTESEIDWPVLDVADLPKLDTREPKIETPPPAPVQHVPPSIARPVEAVPPPPPAMAPATPGPAAAVAPPPAPTLAPPPIAVVPEVVIAPAFVAPEPAKVPEPEPLPTHEIDMLTPIQEALEAEVAAASARPSVPTPPAPVPPPAPVAAPKPVTAQPPAPPVARSSHTTTSNPFATLSAAKAEAAARAAAPIITEEVIEEVVARVLQRMTDHVVRETVAEIVSQTAERLVQEEIERIKNQEQ